MPNYRRHYLPGHSVFVTVVTNRRRPWLGESRNTVLLLEAMRTVKSLHPFRHDAHCVMPDHLHWMFTPEDANFSIIVAAVKRNVTARLKERGDAGSPPYWQSRFYDHVIRDEDDFWRHLDYIHFNPVKHGVASAPADHLHSSFQEWCKRGVYEADWGRKEPDDIALMSLE